METSLQLFEKTQLTAPEMGSNLGDSVAEFLLIKGAQLQPKSLKTYSESLAPLVSHFGADRDLETITRTELVYYLGSQSRTPAGVFMLWQTAGFFFKWYWQAEPEKNPMSQIHMKRPKRDPIRGISPAEVSKIIKQINGPTAARDRALIAVLFASGLRSAEFCGLQLQDVNQRTGRISVRSETAKGRKWREVYITGKALLLLNRWIKKAADQDPAAAVWQTRSGSALKIEGIRDIIGRECQAAGLEQYSFHDFRRGCALEMKRQGADIKDISHFLGHADLKTTERYLALDDTDNLSTAVRFDPLK